MSDFIGSFEQLWNERFDAIDALLEDLNPGDAPPTSPTAPTAPAPKEQDG